MRPDIFLRCLIVQVWAGRQLFAELGNIQDIYLMIPVVLGQLCLQATKYDIEIHHVVIFILELYFYEYMYAVK